MKMTRLTPMLPVSSMPASIEFYQKLGFSVEQRNDVWRWAMLRFDECRVLLDESMNAHPGAPRSSVLYLYPDDISRYHQLVRERVGCPRPGRIVLRHDGVSYQRSGR